MLEAATWRSNPIFASLYLRDIYFFYRRSSFPWAICRGGLHGAVIRLLFSFLLFHFGSCPSVGFLGHFYLSVGNLLPLFEVCLSFALCFGIGWGL